MTDPTDTPIAPIPTPFKAGDRVEMIDPENHPGTRDVPLGTLGTITEAVENDCPGFGDGWYIDWGYTHQPEVFDWAYSCQLRLVTTGNTTGILAEIEAIIARLRELEDHYSNLAMFDTIIGFANNFGYTAEALELLVAGDPWQPALAGLEDCND